MSRNLRQATGPDLGICAFQQLLFCAFQCRERARWRWKSGRVVAGPETKRIVSLTVIRSRARSLSDGDHQQRPPKDAPGPDLEI